MAEVILDASAVLAFLQAEPGGEAALADFAVAAMSSVNYAEVITKLIQNGAEPDLAQAIVDNFAFDIVSADAARGALAGRLHARTRGHGVSLGDRFCLALAEESGLPVLTADRRWKDLGLGVEVKLIR